MVAPLTTPLDLQLTISIIFHLPVLNVWLNGDSALGTSAHLSHTFPPAWSPSTICALTNTLHHAAKLRGERVLVCGASTGIGEELAYTYARAGARIIIAARRRAKLEAVAERARRLGAMSVEVAAVDLSSAEGCSELVEIVQKGPLRAAVLNHIIGYWGDWLAESDGKQQFLEKLFDVNALSYIRLSVPLLDALEETGGELLVVSSGAAKVASPRVAPYAATKGAVQAYFDSLRQDMALAGRRASITTCVLGNIDTPNAKVNTHGDIDHLGWSRASDTAVFMAKATAVREPHTFYPYTMLSATNAMRALAPSAIDWVTRNVIARQQA